MTSASWSQVTAAFPRAARNRDPLNRATPIPIPSPPQQNGGVVVARYDNTTVCGCQAGGVSPAGAVTTCCHMTFVTTLVKVLFLYGLAPPLAQSSTSLPSSFTAASGVAPHANMPSALVVLAVASQSLPSGLVNTTGTMYGLLPISCAMAVI